MTFVRGVLVLGMVAYAGCQSSGGTQPKGGDAKTDSNIQAPTLSLGFGSQDPSKEIQVPKVVIPLTFSGGTYTSTKRVRVPEREQVLLVLKATESFSPRRAAFHRHASSAEEGSIVEFQRLADGSFVLGLDRKVLVAAIRSETQTLEGSIEIASVQGASTTYWIELPLSMALPAISVQSGGRITGKHLSSHPGVIGRDLNHGELFAEDMSFENPSWVPLKIFVRLTTRGIFRQVSRLDYFQPPVDMITDHCKVPSGPRLTARYYSATFEVSGLSLIRTREGQTKTEDLELPNDWLVLSLAPQEKVQILYRLRGVGGSGRTQLPLSASCIAFDLRRLSPGSYDATDTLLFHGWRLRGFVHRSLVVALENLGVRDVEEAVIQGGDLGERGRILTGSEDGNAPLKSSASFETRYGKEISNSEWENPAPAGKYPLSVIDIGSSM